MIAVHSPPDLLSCSERDFRNQTLGSMDLERERGITIHMHPVTVYHEHAGKTYELELYTPGHVDCRLLESGKRRRG